jgi:hypothetical protein
MQQKTDATVEEKKILDLDRYRLKMKLRDSGVEWHEDTKGKFKIWLRLGNQVHVAQQ